MSDSPRYLVIANPAGRRWQAYSRDLLAFWSERGVTPAVEVLPWSAVVPRRGDLRGLTELSRPAIVRLESPGRDLEVKRLLLRAGGHSPWPYENFKGHLTSPSSLHDGFRAVLAGLKSTFDSHPALQPLACPLAVAELFDKNATSARLATVGIPVPPRLPPPTNAATLIELIRANRWPVAYVKLNTGSSASGQAVVHALDDPPWAITSVARLGSEFFNSRRLTRITGDDLNAVLTMLLAEGAFVQRGISMAQIDGLNFDVRVVVIHGEPRFTVFRLSPNPMTNLHLGGRRGDPIRCRAAVPSRIWLDALDHCVEAASLYDCAAVGVDLVFERGYFRHSILELNAFGDWFPGLTDERGRSVHRTEIEETARRLAPCPDGPSR